MRSLLLGAGLRHSVVVQDGEAYSFGAAALGQLGIGLTGERAMSIPLKVPLIESVISVACGGDHSILTTSSGAAWAFGRNEDGQLGNGSTEHAFSATTMVLPGPAVQ